MGEPVASEQGHKSGDEGEQTIIEGLEGAFATDGITDEDSDKVDHIVMAKTATGKAYAFLKSGKHALLLQIMGDEGHFSEPGGG